MMSIRLSIGNGLQRERQRNGWAPQVFCCIYRKNTQIKQAMAWQVFKETNANGLLHFYPFLSSLRKGHGFCKVGLMIVQRTEHYSTQYDVVSYNNTDLPIVGNRENAMKEEGDSGTVKFKNRMYEPGPNLSTYDTKVNWLYKQKKMEVGHAVNEMKTRDTFPNSNICSTMMIGYAELRKLDDAFLLFCKMVKQGIRPTVSVYSSLIGGYCREGKIEGVLNMCNKMIENGLASDIITCNALILGFCKNGEMKKTKKILCQMWKNGLIPDEKYLNCCPKLIGDYSKEGKLQEVCKSCTDKTEKYLTIDTVPDDALIGSFCKRGLLLDANILLNKVLETGQNPSASSYEMLIAGYLKVGSMEQVFKLSSEMLGMGYIPNLLLATALFSGLCKRCKMNDANHLLNLMVEKGFLPDDVIYNLMILENCKACNSQEASKWNDHMLEKGILPCKDTLNVLINELCKNHSMREATKLLNTMLEINLVPDDRTVRALLDMYTEEGNLEEALKLYDKWISKEGMQHAMTDHIPIACVRNPVQEVKKPLDRMPDNALGLHISTYSWLNDENHGKSSKKEALNLQKELMERGIL